MKKIVILFLLSFIFLYPNFASTKFYNPNQKYVGLSFDDGPSKYTNEIVDYLYNTNSTATFFVIGNKVSNYKDILINIINNGSEIGNHTFSHPWLSRLSNEKILEEINKTQEIINKITGTSPTLFRPSYGDINSKLKKIVDLEIVMWTNDSRDWKYKNPKTIASNVIRNIKDFDIILMHDTYERTLESLKIIIPTLQNMGYKIVSISELMIIKDLYGLHQY